MDSSPPVDLLVIAALPEELRALLEVREGLLEPWRLVDGDPPHHVAVFDGHAGRIHVATARLTRMGGVATTDVAVRLIGALQPRALAMAGVCAGHPQDTHLGDVIIADRVFQYDEGKHTLDGFQADLRVNSLTDPWLRVAQDMAGPAIGTPGYEQAGQAAGEWWFLDQLLANRDPLKSCALKRYFPDRLRAAMVARLESELCFVRLQGETFALTERGREAAQRRRAFHGTAIERRPRRQRGPRSPRTRARGRP